MQTKQFVFFLSFLVIPDIQYSSENQRVHSKKSTNFHHYDATIMTTLNTKLLKLETELQQLKVSNTERVAQDTIIRDYTQKQFDEINTYVKQLEKKQKIDAQKNNAKLTVINNLTKQTQALNSFTTANFYHLNACLFGLLETSNEQRKIIENIHEHIQAMHESRQKLEVKLKKLTQRLLILEKEKSKYL